MMSLNHFLIFIIPLIFGLNECQDFCQLVRPKNQYEGLGIYRRFQKGGDGHYVMFNRAGSQWKFTIERGKSSAYANWRIQLTNSSVEKVNDEKLITRFGIRFIGEKEDLFLNCRLEQRKSNTSQSVSLCEVWYTSSKVSMPLEVGTVFTLNFVVLKPWSRDDSNEGKRNYLLVINKDNRTDYWVYNPKETDLINCYTTKDPAIKKMCTKPKFIDQMDGNLFKKIDGVVDFNFGRTLSGHLLFFNIDGRPKYCFTDEYTHISKQCKSPNNMKSLLEECFPTETPIPEKSLTILFIVIIAVLIIAIIAVIVCRSGQVSEKVKLTKGTEKTKKSLRYSSEEGEKSEKGRSPSTSMKTNGLNPANSPSSGRHHHKLRLDPSSRTPN